MKDSEQTKFKVSVNVGTGEYKSLELTIQPDETTDGVAFYHCEVNNVKISQLRRDGNKWEQLWGNLDEGIIKNIGKAIELHSIL